MATLTELLQSIYGLRTVSKTNQLVDTVATTTTHILKANPNRLNVLIVNNGTNAMFILPSRDVNTTKGIYVSPYGGFVSLAWSTDYELLGQDWFAISTSGSTEVTIIETLSQ